MFAKGADRYPQCRTALLTRKRILCVGHTGRHPIAGGCYRTSTVGNPDSSLHHYLVDFPSSLYIRH